MNTVRVTVTEGGRCRVLEAVEGQRLYDVLRAHDVHLTAPCGGRGTCGKCAVLVDGRREQSCRYHIEHDIAVVMPERRRAEILEQAGELRRVENGCGLAPAADGQGVVSTIAGAERTIAADPGRLFGLAVDIGTTTVVVYLEDLVRYEARDVESFVNPQARHGHDVISRIHYVMEHAEGLARLRDEIRFGISSATRALCERTGIDPSCVCKAVIAGNNTMLHLFAGADPSPIAAAPYTPRFTARQVLRGDEAGLAMNPAGVVVLLPSVSAYVGADITAGIASTDLCERDEFSLFVDIGTNGEMALGNRMQLHCCSTAAGPAFEGATIRCGTGGIAGAISHYADGALETIDDLPPIGICGSGVLDIAAELRRKGTIDTAGYMEKDFLVAPAAATSGVGDIVFAPSDAREVQLASAAIFAGIRIMLKESGVAMEQVRRLYLAGGFGNYLRVESAVAVGLLPQSLAGRVVPVGNSAGSGARLALRSEQFGAEVTRVAETARYIELSMRQDFNEEFVMAMALEPRD